MVDMIIHIAGFGMGATMSFMFLLYLAGKMKIKHQIEINNMVKENIRLSEIVRNFSDEKVETTGVVLYGMYGETKTRLEENKDN